MNIGVLLFGVMQYEKLINEYCISSGTNKTKLFVKIAVKDRIELPTCEMWCEKRLDIDNKEALRIVIEERLNMELSS